ncbi:hypothetical protein PM082_023596 [Marasmius tenuissimus]|nr:hypothetical protein PM082_023596 [Marasmius tenuissimus]
MSGGGDFFGFGAKKSTFRGLFDFFWASGWDRQTRIGLKQRCGVPTGPEENLRKINVLLTIEWRKGLKISLPLPNGLVNTGAVMYETGWRGNLGILVLDMSSKKREQRSRVLSLAISVQVVSYATG